MEIENTNLRAVLRDTYQIDLKFVGADEVTPVNITGSTIYFTVKNNKTDTDAQKVIQKIVTVHTDPTHGETSIVCSKTETTIAPKTYFYDIQYVSSIGEVKTIAIGTIVFIQDITITS